MNPDSAQNLPPVSPASLPAAPSQAQTPGIQQPSGPTPVSSMLAEEVASQAKTLVEQYQQSPYQLSGAIQQLKAKYLADQFHITPNSTEQ